MMYDYYYYTNLYSKSECAEIVEFIQKNQSTHHKDSAPSWKNVKTTVIETPKIKHLLTKFFSRVYETNDKYYGFNLKERNPYTVNLNTYDKNASYNTHQDRVNAGEMWDIKLTAILNCSQEPYEGGEFEFIFGENAQRIKELDLVGSLLIFPSFHFHRVKPVLSGTRLTVSAWFHGPNWQ